MRVSELTLSEDQERALDAVADWYASVPSLNIPQFCEDPDCEGQGRRDVHGERVGQPHTHGFAHDHPVMSVGGLAGTGKTTITRLLAERLSALASFATPTHKAAAVLRRKLSGDETVRTYHSLIYYPLIRTYCTRSGDTVELDEAHRCEGGTADECGCPDRFTTCGACTPRCRVEESISFERRQFLAGMHHLIVVDEASMLTESQVDDIRAFGVPVLLIGDHGQLPPVKAEMNPWIRDPRVVLEHNHRQGESSGIIDVAHAVRRGWRPTPGRYGDGSTVVIDRRERNDAVVAMLRRFEAGPRRAVIVWRNSTRCLLNGLLRGREGDPQPGDRVVCLRGATMRTATLGPTGWEREHNQKYVHNGELGTVMAARPATGPNSMNKTVMAVKLDDPDPENGITRPCVITTAATAQFGRPTALGLNDKDRPRGQLGTDWHSWDYGYALTAHKAQGSEWDQVVVVDERAMDYERWTYTAVTRAKKQLVVVRW